VDPGQIVLDDVVPIPLCRGGSHGEILSIVQYRNIAVRIRCGFCQITLASCLFCNSGVGLCICALWSSIRFNSCLKTHARQ